MIKAELVLWVAGFVLLSLIINAPKLPWIMRITRLNTGQPTMPADICRGCSCHKLVHAACLFVKAFSA